MSIEYMSSPSGWAPQMVALPPGAAIAKGSVVKFTSGKVQNVATGALAAANAIFGIAEEAATADVTPPLINVTIISPGDILRVTSSNATAVVNGASYDITAGGASIDSSAGGTMANNKVQVICPWPGETRANTVVGAQYMARALIGALAITS